MPGSWNIFSWGSGEKEKEQVKDFEPLCSSPLSETSSCTSFSSPVLGIPDGAEEFVDAYGPDVSDSEASTSAGGANDDDRSSVIMDGETPLAQPFHKPFLENGPDMPQKVGWGLTSRRAVDSSSRGASYPNTVLSGRSPASNKLLNARKVSTSYVDLKQVQIQKYQKLVPLDNEWDKIFPFVEEPSFSWPWPSLTEQQIELGKMSFKKFLVVQCCYDVLGLKPEDELTLDEIMKLDELLLEGIPSYVSRMVALKRGARVDATTISTSWLKDGLVSFECNVEESGKYRMKIVQPKQVGTLLHRTFELDRVMVVYFNKGFSKLCADDKYDLIRNGIYVGLRRYRFWGFKDTGKEDHANRDRPKEKDYERAVKCYFVCTQSLADVDLSDPKFKIFIRAHAVRCHIMHAHTVPNMAKFCYRLPLALSKSMSLVLGPEVELVPIDDILCKDEFGREMEHTNGTGEISPDFAKLLPSSAFKGKPDKKKIKNYPTLVQARGFSNGRAIKGTFQVNHKLKGLQICFRPSMVKVYPDNVIKDFPTVNTFEIVTTCRKPREAKLSQDLILLLSIGGVPPKFFHDLVQTALDNISNMFTSLDIAYEEVKDSTSDFGLGDQTLRMIAAGIPLSHPQMQKNLRSISQMKMRDLRKGCVSLPDTYYLMGTSDPTEEKILKRDQVAIANRDGKVWGKVLVYKNPGKHPGDVHVFDAIWDERLDPFVGPSKHTIFFSVQGDRPIVDEIANADLDGDMYWICENTELISQFNHSDPWMRPEERILTSTEPAPGELSAGDLEIAHFDKFLKARFHDGAPPMPMAATCWRAHMDKYLVAMVSGASTEQLDAMVPLISSLINIFYRALDAGKSGEEVELPPKFFPEKWPHHMKKDDLTKNGRKKFYHSPSILGQIHDMANPNIIDRLVCSRQESMVHDSNFEFGNFAQYKVKWKDYLLTYNKETSGDNEANRRVVEKYQQILKPRDRPWTTQIWEEASAIYSVNFEHAEKYVNEGSYAPSLNFAMSIALPELCEIYARNLGGGELFVWAPGIRQELLGAR